jgi:hypothetical protein
LQIAELIKSEGYSPWANENSTRPIEARNESKYSRRYETEKNSPGIFHQNNSNYEQKSQMRRQYKSAHRNHDIFNRKSELESQEGVNLLVDRLRGILKASNLRTYDLLFIANALIKSFVIGKSVSAEEFQKILSAVMVNLDIKNCQKISRGFLQSIEGVSKLLDKLKGKTSSRRKTIEMKLWIRLDFHSRRFSYYGNLLSLFNADYHPLVISGRLTKNEMQTEFEKGLKLFEEIKGLLLYSKGVYGQRAKLNDAEGGLELKMIKEREFVEWFSFLSFEEDDEYKFDVMMKDTFKIQ